MRRVLTWIAAGLATCFLASCQNEKSEPAQVKGNAKGAGSEQHAHDHDHAKAGPHGGRLIELGREEYHGEWVHDDQSGKVTVYMLDGEAEQAFPIEAKAIVVLATIDNEEQEFKLEPVSPSTDTPPKTAQFELVNKKLGELLKSVGHGVEATLTADIEGKVFVGKFEDIHDHHDH